MYESLITPPAVAPATSGGNPSIDAALAAEGVSGREAEFIKSIYQQESGSGSNTKTSNAGAVGGMQIIPSTFRSVADQGWDIQNPEHNLRAGIRYARQGYKESGGDPVLAGAFYYGGPGGMAKARDGIAVSDPRNPNAPNTLQYGAQVAKRMGAAPAATAAAAAPADAPYFTPASGGYASLITPPPLARTTLEAAKDVALGAGAGVVQGVEMVASAFGADNAVARGANDAAQSLIDMQSPARKQQREQRAAAIQEAETSGSTWSEIVANVGAFADAPVESTLNAIGTSVPTLLTALIPGLGQANVARLVVQGAVGAAQGAGAVKGSIYEAVERELSKPGPNALSADDAKKAAAAAQAYDSQNGGDIALGALLGWAAGSTGIERSLAKILSKEGGEAAASGIAKRAAMGVIAEAPMEGLQGGQERLAANRALQNEGVDVPTWQGVAGSAAGEAVASVVPGGVFGALTPSKPPLPPELAPVAEKADEPNSPLSKAAMAANTPEVIAQREAQRQAAEPVQTDPAARLAELEAIGEGAPESRSADGQTIPGTPGRFFTLEEKAEYDDLVARRDATPGAKPAEADAIGDRAKEIAAAVRDSGALEALRADDSPVNASDLVKDLATAQSPNTPAAAREQAIGRVEFALQWAGVDIAPAPNAKDEPKSDQQVEGMPEQKPAQIDPVIAAMSNPKVAPDDKAALRDSYNAALNIRLPQATRDQALAQAREIAGRYAAADVPKASAGAETSGERAQAPAVLGPIEGAPATLLAQAERLEDGAFQLAAEDFPDEAQELRDQAASLRKQAEGARSSEPAQGRWSAGFDGITPAPAKRATAAQTTAPAGANEITIRANNIASSIGGSGALDALRSLESPVSAKELIENLATAQNPAAPAASREEALGRVEFALEWAGIDIKPADQQTAAAQSQEEQSADQQPAPQELTEVADGKQADLVSQAERMEAGAAQFDSEGFTVEAQQLRDQADSLREQAATVRAGEAGQDLEADAPAGIVSPEAQQTVALPTVRSTPAGDGPAYLRRRRASLQQLAANGFTTVRRDGEQFAMTNPKTGQTFSLDGAADAQLARKAIADNISAAAAQTNTDPTDGQKSAGNYKKARVDFEGITIAIENPVGSERKGKSDNGKAWATPMNLAHYGYLPSTSAADGDGVDVYVMNTPRIGAQAYVIDQYNEDGSFDETKTVLGASSESEALRVYDAGFSDGSGPDRRGAVTAMSIADFKAWANTPAAKKPAGPAPEPAPGAVVEGSMKVKLSEDESVSIDLIKELPEVESVARGGRATRISKKQGAVIKAIAQAFGKRVQFYTGADSGRVGDGFIMPNDQGTIYLNATSSMSPVVVFGHELMHQLKRDNPEAHAAIEAVVARRMNREAVAATYGKLGYNNGQIMEELISDLGGDLMADKAFWADVMAEVREANGDGPAKKILAQLAEFLYRAIDAMSRSLRSYADTGAGSKLVDDMTEIRAAFQAALAGYMQTHGIAKPSMQAEILRAGQEAKRSAVRNQTPEDQRKALAEKLRGTDGWLKAPNGKKTNLDERQWVVVRTPAFKAWFGDWESDPANASKAVDENGEPKVFYHGSTEAGFTEFDTDGKGKTEGTGAFFADDFRMAVGYSGTRNDAPVYPAERVFADPDLIDGLSIEESGILVEVVTNSRGGKSWEWYESEEAALEDLELDPGEELVRKPGYRMTDPDGYETVGTKEEIIDAISDIKVRAPGVYDAFLNVRDLVTIDWQGKNWDEGPEEQIWNILDEDGEIYDTAYSQEDADAILAKKPGFSVEQTSQSQYDSTDDAARSGRDMGADGVLIKDVFDTGPKGYAEDGNVLVVYDPRNIKSASANTGAFDSANANITRSADRSDSPEFRRWFGRPGVDSNLVNEDGSPMRLYHGTNAKFTEFRRSKTGAMGPGIYLGDDRSVAEAYDGNGRGEQIIMEVYARGKYLSNRQWSDYVFKHGWAGAEAAAKADGWSGVRDTRYESAVSVWDPADIKSATNNTGKFGEGADITRSADRSDALTIEGYHFSHADRPMLTTGMYGTGLRGSARDAIMSHPDKRLRQRLSFYFDKGTGIRPESGVGGRAHRVQLTGVYDADVDPLKLKSADARAFESRLLDAGYSGYMNRMEGTQPGQVIMLGRQTFTPELLGAQSYISASRRIAPIESAPSRWLTQASGEPAMLQARLERMQASDSWSGYELRINGRELQARAKPGGQSITRSASRLRDDPMEVSSRAPWGKTASEDPIADLLVVGLDSSRAGEKAFEKNIALVREYPNYRPTKSASTTERQAERFIEMSKDNLLWLYDSVPAEIRERSHLWYDGANRIAKTWAPKYSLQPSQIAGVMAVLSPQKDWFMNVDLARRLIDTMSAQGNTRWNAEMTATAQRIFGKPQYADDVAAITGKTLDEVNDLVLKAMWVRAYDETYNDRAHALLSPEGDVMGKVMTMKNAPSKVAWGDLGSISKAVAIIQDGSLANISTRLGGEHKVRNFYNNILVPNGANGHVTIDTHAVAAALLRPLSGSSLEVLHNFGSAGAANSAIHGSSGTYGLYAEAYRRAAAERGILAREMQSITWEAVRGLFTPGFKSQQKNVDTTDGIWENYRKGRLSLENARQQILETAGGIEEPSWFRSGTGSPAPEGRGDAGGVPGVQLPGRRAGSAAGGTGSPAAEAAAVQRSAARDRGRQQLAADQALPGSPRVEGATGPDHRLVAVAEAYAQKVGIDLRRQAEYVQVDEKRAARIAAAYETMEHAPQNRKVKAAYADLIKQTRAQYDALVEAGYSFYFADQTNDPYGGNPWNAMRDLRANQQMAVFPTAAGFGSNETFDPADNPLLADTGLVWGYGSPDGQGMRVLANDLFRAVHDAFGHGLEGAGFRAQGEENAWQAHIRMFTGAAKGAITSETRGQNSWLNFNEKSGEANRTAKVEDTVFADQKTGLMPEWTWTEGVAGDMPAVRSAARDITSTPEFKAWFGDSKVVDAEGKPLVVYHGAATGFTEFKKKNIGARDPGFFGAGFYFAPDEESAQGYADSASEADGGSAAGEVIPSYVSLKNPFVWDMEPGDGAKSTRNALARFGVERSSVRGDSAALSNPDERKRFNAAVRAAGHDGVIVRDEDGFREIVAFEPTQIKSAIGNNGAFDPNDANITRSASRDLPKATLADFEPRGISRLLGVDSWAILTAENPMGEQAGEKTNAAAMRRLRQRLAEMDGVEFRAIRGKYGDNEENSLAVVGITEEQAVELGREFNQDSVLTRKGFIYQDGSINPATGIEVFRSPPENYYSRIGDTIFRIDIDFDTKINPAADAAYNQRIDALKELIACLGK